MVLKRLSAEGHLGEGPTPERCDLCGLFDGLQLPTGNQVGCPGF